MSRTFRRKDNRFRNTPKADFLRDHDNTDQVNKFHTDSLAYFSPYYDSCTIKPTHGEIRSRYRNRLKTFQGLHDFEDCEVIDLVALEKKYEVDYWW